MPPSAGLAGMSSLLRVIVPNIVRKKPKKPGDASGDFEKNRHQTPPLVGVLPRARLDTSDGKTTEWKSHMLGAYQRRTLAADALIAGCYLSGTNTRRVRRALATLFRGAVG